jgi:hypothetical protein
MKCPTDEEEDPLVRWTTYTYPAHLDLLYFKPDDAELHFGLEDTYSTPSEEEKPEHPVRHNKHRFLMELPSKGMNCSVAFMSHCMSLRRCKDSCRSMGAARYRWFHEHGCCECIGSTCLDYGKAEALCMKCPTDEEEEEEDYYDMHEHNKYHDNEYDIEEDYERDEDYDEH